MAVDDRFFARPTLEVAEGLIGCRLGRGRSRGVIVETEAYTDDAASHYITRAPSAGALMGGTHGRIYVYRIYGRHLCLNFTSDERGPGAVLIRALTPTGGLDLMRRRRGVQRERDLCSGPAKLARALGVRVAMNGRPVLEAFELCPPAVSPDVVATPRVGISRARELPWRFTLRGSPFVSRPAPGA